MVTNTVQSTTTVAQKQEQMKSEKERFIATFNQVVNILMEDMSSTFDLHEDNLAYIRKVLSYNVPHGKLNRGLAVYQCYKAFHPDPEHITEKEENDANLLGWCVELLQAFFLVADDIMDESHTRRGQACFYKLPEIGLNAINDSLILEMMIYRILRIKFSDNAYMLHLFQDISYTTEIGQLLDLTSQIKSGETDFNRFTEDVLSRIYKYKTSHYTFYLPVALGMRLANVKDERCYKTGKDICLKMGHYFQAQDDFLDAFGDPKITGKVGTDIEDNTCTWLIVEAVKLVNAEQKQILMENYGKRDSVYSNRIKDVYRELKLPEAFRKFEQESYQTLRKLIDDVDHMPTGAFEFLLAKIYKRDK